MPITGAELGGASAHARSTGLATLVATGIDEALEAVADVLTYLPDSVDALPARIPTDDPADRADP